MSNSKLLIELSREESKLLHKTLDQLKMQQLDLMNKKKILDESLSEITSLLAVLNKPFKVTLEESHNDPK